LNIRPASWFEEAFDGEEPKLLGERFGRFSALVRNEGLVNDRNKHAFLLTQREKFVLQQNLSRAYADAFLDIGYGVTISGPHLVGRITSNIDPKPHPTNPAAPARN
jgi:protein-L-isoaspartate(D-aspartate) O-methyltransferase